MSRKRQNEQVCGPKRASPLEPDKPRTHTHDIRRGRPSPRAARGAAAAATTRDMKRDVACEIQSRFYVYTSARERRGRRKFSSSSSRSSRAWPRRALPPRARSRTAPAPLPIGRAPPPPERTGGRGGVRSIPLYMYSIPFHYITFCIPLCASERPGTGRGGARVDRRAARARARGRDRGRSARRRRRRAAGPAARGGYPLGR